MSPTPDPTRLTKTRVLAGLQCPKRLWLAAHRPELATALDPDARARMATGRQIDWRARAHFADGKLIASRVTDEALAQTEAALAAGTTTLFQPAFRSQGVTVRADILHRIDAGWQLYEVKSTLDVKAEHLLDLAVQWLVLTTAGLPLAGAGVMHLNREYVHPGPADLFTFSDVTDRVAGFLPEVAGALPALTAVLQRPGPPGVPIGRHCQKPHACAFKPYCWHGVLQPVFDIPRLKETHANVLSRRGVEELSDLPGDFRLTAAQQAYVARTLGRTVAIDRSAIAAALAALQFPLYFLDFETDNPALPRYEGTRPYQQIPFQFSCHRLGTDGLRTQAEYLHLDETNPRPALTAALLDAIGPAGTVIAYNVGFEKRVLKELAAALRDQAPALTGIVDRLWDLAPIISKHYQHYAFGPSYSLKSVLPVLCPDLSYDDLAVSDGTSAQLAWTALLATPAGPHRDRLAANLRQYVTLDTFALVRILGHLRGVVGA